MAAIHRARGSDGTDIRPAPLPVVVSICGWLRARSRARRRDLTGPGQWSDVVLLVVPYRVGDLALAERYEAVLSRSRGLLMVDVDRDVLRAAAQIRAVYGTRPPDAIQLASAALHRCSAFVTNDRRLPDAGIRVIQLDELEE